jgi:Heavy metal binding domain
MSDCTHHDHSRHSAKSFAPGKAAESDLYTCPMHPEILRDKPGTEILAFGGSRNSGCGAGNGPDAGGYSP